MKNLIISVSELNEYVRLKLASDDMLHNISIIGEISNLKKHYSGHWYFSLKDSNAVISCVMFRQYNNSIKFIPVDGLQVVLTGSASLYTKSGQYQFYAQKMAREGEGDLNRKFELLKKKLQAEGLFDDAHKKPIPMLPKKIGVVTSASGAVIHDILQVAQRRNSNIPICLCPASVQGENAAATIVKAIKRLSCIDDIDIIIIGRGGGSLEDLFCFNEEAVARAIYECEIPIISAVGHETDFTISDFVADMRAATPSAAAEIAVIPRNDLLYTIGKLNKNLENTTKSRINDFQNSLNKYFYILEKYNPKQQIKLHQNNINILSLRLKHVMQDKYNSSYNLLQRFKAKIETENPTHLLECGYAYVSMEGKIISNTKGIKAGDNITVHMQDANLEALVNKKVKKECIENAEN